MSPAEMREIRKGLGLTQAAMAKLFGVDHPHGAPVGGR